MNKCAECGLETSNPKFCSRSCHVTHSNKLRKTKRPDCLNCGVSLRGMKGSKYCCRSCQHEYHQATYIERWKAGLEDGAKGLVVSSRIRRYLFDKHSRSCSKCGWSVVNEFTGKTPLEIHHIDGDYKNNKEDNLELLCPNCHSLTPTFKALNKNGRSLRLQSI